VVHKKNGHAMDYFDGIPIGLYVPTNDRFLIYNHLNITVFTHTTFENAERIVGFEVEPMSLSEDENRNKMDEKYSGAMFLEPGKNFRFSYSIRTVVSLSARLRLCCRMMIARLGG
jgi:hypothetical protein